MEMADSQLMQYIPVVILGIVAVGFAAGTLFASVLLGKRGKDSRIKDTAYECGMLPVGDGNTRLSVKFYLVAMLFILFDIEVVFLYPWAVIYRGMLANNAGLILGFDGLFHVHSFYRLPLCVEKRGVRLEALSEPVFDQIRHVGMARSDRPGLYF